MHGFMISMHDGMWYGDAACNCYSNGSDPFQSMLHPFHLVLTTHSSGGIKSPPTTWPFPSFSCVVSIDPSFGEEMVRTIGVVWFAKLS